MLFVAFALGIVVGIIGTAYRNRVTRADLRALDGLDEKIKTIGDNKP